MTPTRCLLEEDKFGRQEEEYGVSEDFSTDPKLKKKDILKKSFLIVFSLDLAIWKPTVLCSTGRNKSPLFGNVKDQLSN